MDIIKENMHLTIDYRTKKLVDNAAGVIRKLMKQTKSEDKKKILMEIYALLGNYLYDTIT